MTQLIITKGRTTIEFPDTKLTVVHPFYGPANSKTLREQIRKDGLREPTSSQLAIFAHSLYKRKHPIEQEVTSRMKYNYFRSFTGILYDPKEKVAHFIDYPEFDDKSMVDKDNLIKRIGESRAQVPFENLREGPVKWYDVAKHPYFIAWAGGEEGAEKLSELALRLPSKKAFISVPNVLNLEEIEAKTATLVSDWNGSSLSVVASDLGSDWEGYAFGVRVGRETRRRQYAKK